MKIAVPVRLDIFKPIHIVFRQTDGFVAPEMSEAEKFIKGLYLCHTIPGPTQNLKRGICEIKSPFLAYVEVRQNKKISNHVLR